MELFEHVDKLNFASPAIRIRKNYQTTRIMHEQFLDDTGATYYHRSKHEVPMKQRPLDRKQINGKTPYRHELSRPNFFNAPTLLTH
jgi:hypothetical protein